MRPAYLLIILSAVTASAQNSDARADLVLKVLSYDRKAVRVAGPLVVVTVGPVRLPAEVQGRAVKAVACTSENFEPCTRNANPEVVLFASQPALSRRTPTTVRYVLGVDEASVAAGTMLAIADDGQLVINPDALAARGVELEPQVLRRARRASALAKEEPITLPEEADPPEAFAENVMPAYPETTREKGLEGEVVLRIGVGSTGTVTSMKVLKGDEPFVAAALSAVNTWKYKPARLEGRAIAVFKIVKIPFRLR